MDSPTPKDKIQLAIKAYQLGELPSMRSTASAFNVPWPTFRGRLDGAQTNRASKQHTQRSTPEEEGATRPALQQMHAWRWPTGISGLESLA
jgi:hypothetical protein